MLTFTDTVNERRSGSKVVAMSRPGNKVRTDTIQFIHDYTDILSTHRHFNFSRFFNTHTECMAVDACRKVVQTVSEVKCLRISHVFAKLLDSAVDVTTVYVDFLHNFTIQSGAEVHYAVGRRVLWTYINNVVVFFKHIGNAFNQIAVCIFHDTGSKVGNLFIDNGNWVERRVSIVIFAKRKSVPVAIQEESAHVRIVDKADTQHGIHFALVEMSSFIHICDGVEQGIFTIFGSRDYHYFFAHVFGRRKQVDYTQFFTPIHPD